MDFPLAARNPAVAIQPMNSPVGEPVASTLVDPIEPSSNAQALLRAPAQAQTHPLEALPASARNPHEARLRTWLRHERTQERAVRIAVNHINANRGEFSQGELVLVQLDLLRLPGEPIHPSRGQTYVFQLAGGQLRDLGAFNSTSQPTMTTGSYFNTRVHGPSFIRPGAYEVSRTRQSDSFLGGKYRFAPDNFPTHRDTNHDGALTPDEQRIHGTHADAILIHAWGQIGTDGQGNTGGVGLVGCQGIWHAEFADFEAAIAQGRGPTMTYILVRDGMAAANA